MTAARNGHVFLVDGRWLSWYGARAAEGLAGLEALFDKARPNWQPPARPVTKPVRTAKSVATAEQAGAGTASATSPAAAPAEPRRTPKIDTPMPPGLKLQIRSQEVVEE
jgi:hypothetical protein